MSWEPNKKTKTLLRIILGVAVFCIIACLAFPLLRSAFVKKVTIFDPEELTVVAQNIVDYDLPPDYNVDSGIKTRKMKFVFFTKDGVYLSATTDPIIIIGEMPYGSEIDEEQMMLELQKSARRATNTEGYNVELVDKSIAAIRGQAVAVYTYEGRDIHDEMIKHEITGTFTGKDGAVFLAFMGYTWEWDQEEIDAFMDSIR
ncbi:MAG: hypothetical protein RBT34_00130 [Anaerolineaceae bacterium]|jgi:hypothetical protein|nr:hypothetical protein [Anaerolineaceae bacterium]